MFRATNQIPAVCCGAGSLQYQVASVGFILEYIGTIGNFDYTKLVCVGPQYLNYFHILGYVVSLCQILL